MVPTRGGCHSGSRMLVLKERLMPSLFGDFGDICKSPMTVVLFHCTGLKFDLWKLPLHGQLTLVDICYELSARKK